MLLEYFKLYFILDALEFFEIEFRKHLDVPPKIKVFLINTKLRF